MNGTALSVGQGWLIDWHGNLTRNIDEAMVFASDEEADAYAAKHGWTAASLSRLHPQNIFFDREQR